MTPLREHDIIRADPQLFIRNVLAGYSVLERCSAEFYGKIEECDVDIPRDIGDIFYEHLLAIETELKHYLSNIPLAEYIIKKEKRQNRMLAQLLEETLEKRILICGGHSRKKKIPHLPWSREITYIFTCDSRADSCNATPTAWTL